MAKNANGDGTIFRRKSGPMAGKWVGAITLGYVDGKPKRKWFSADTRKEALVLLDRAKQDRDAGHHLGTKQQTVGQFLTYWLDEVAAVKLAPMSLLTYRSLVKTHLAPRLGHHQLARLSQQHIQEALNATRKAGMAPRSIRLIREVLRGALEQAVEYKMIYDNPASRVTLPQVDDESMNFLTPDEAKTLLRTAEADRWYALYACALFLGLRRGEVLGLRWKDVDFEAGTLQVAQAMQVLNGKITFTTPKTKHSRRLLPIPDMLRTILHDHRLRMLTERLAAQAIPGERWPRTTSEDLVFVTEDGEPIHISRLHHHFKQLLDRAGLRHCTMHALRHSCATLLISLNVPLPIVRDIMGHSNISMTMRYVHVLDSGKTEAMDAMSDLFGKQAI